MKVLGVRCPYVYGLALLRRDQPLDLKAMFGNQYVVTMDASWDAETPENRSEFRARGKQWWYYEIKGHRGTIYPFNASTIVVDVTRRRASQLEALLGLALVPHTRCDEAVAYKADVQHIEAILQFIKPRRCKQFTAEQKAILVARLVPYRFKSPKVPHMDHASQTDSAPHLPGVVL